jgi:hypothetical protein
METNERLAKETSRKSLIPMIRLVAVISTAVPCASIDIIEKIIGQHLRLIGPPGSDLRNAWNELIAVLDAGHGAQKMLHDD